MRMISMGRIPTKGVRRERGAEVCCLNLVFLRVLLLGRMAMWSSTKTSFESSRRVPLW